MVAREPKLFSGAVLIGVAPRDGYLTLPFLAKLATAPLIGELTWRTTPDAVVRDQLSRHLAPGSPSLDESIYGASGIPAMAVAGSEDRIVDPAELYAWRRAANVRAVEMQGVGHTPQLEQPAKLARLVEGLAAANPLRRRAGCGDSP